MSRKKNKKVKRLNVLGDLIKQLYPKGNRYRKRRLNELSSETNKVTNR